VLLAAEELTHFGQAHLDVDTALADPAADELCCTR
jgi:hypothetical protein